jgi:predicted nucleic acid-binding protein
LILVDTSVLIASLTPPQPLMADLRKRLQAGELLALSTIVLYEWWRGPRSDVELEAQEILFPRESIVAFGAQEAAIAAQLYKRVSSPRTREMDLAIAACTIARDFRLWTLNRKDFADVPRLKLV